MTETIGSVEFDGAPMRRAAIFGVTSMTKPITAAAAMILVEEQKRQLDDPVERFLPELAHRGCGALDAPVEETVPAMRKISMMDLLTFRPGSGMIWCPPDMFPIEHAIASLGVVGLGLPDQSWMLMHCPSDRARSMIPRARRTAGAEGWTRLRAIVIYRAT